MPVKFDLQLSADRIQRNYERLSTHARNAAKSWIVADQDAATDAAVRLLKGTLAEMTEAYATGNGEALEAELSARGLL